VKFNRKEDLVATSMHNNKFACIFNLRIISKKIKPRKPVPLKLHTIHTNISQSFNDAKCLYGFFGNGYCTNDCCFITFLLFDSSKSPPPKSAHIKAGFGHLASPDTYKVALDGELHALPLLLTISRR